MSTTLKLLRQGEIWCIYDNDEDTAALMGTYILPTPFKTTMDYEEVRARIQKLNPGKLVL